MKYQLGKKWIVGALTCAALVMGSFATTLYAQVVVLNYSEEIPVPDGWMGHPVFAQPGYWEFSAFPLPSESPYPIPKPGERPTVSWPTDGSWNDGEWKPIPMPRYLSCYEDVFPNGTLVTIENARALLDIVITIRVWRNGKFYIYRDVSVIDVYVISDAKSCAQLKEAGLIPKDVALLATDVDLTATRNDTGVDLTLTTSAEPDTAALLILRGDKLENGGTEIDVACDFPSGGSPYTCTDDVVADTYRAAEIEYDGSLILYDEVTAE